MKRHNKYLNIKFNVIDRQLSGRVEGANWVFFNGFHSVIRWLQHVHSAASVSHHHKLRPFESTFGLYAFIMIIYTYSWNTESFISAQLINPPAKKTFWFKFLTLRRPWSFDKGQCSINFRGLVKIGNVRDMHSLEGRSHFLLANLQLPANCKFWNSKEMSGN